MLTKDGWPRGRALVALRCWLLGAAMVQGGCNRLARQVYYPAPTPLFMEEGLREEPPGAIQRSDVGGQRPEEGNQPPELPPPTQPPGPQPVVPEYLPGGQTTGPYEPLPGALGFSNGVTLAQAID